MGNVLVLLKLIVDEIFLSGILHKFKWGDNLNSIGQDVLKFSVHLMATNTQGWIMPCSFLFLAVCPWTADKISAQLTNVGTADKPGIGGRLVPTYNRLLVALALAPTNLHVSVLFLNSARMRCETAVGAQMRCEMAVRGVSGPEGTWREMWDAGAARDAAAGPAAPCAGGRGDRRFSIWVKNSRSL